MKSREQLQEYFKTDLLPGLQELENIRQTQVFRQVFIVVALAVSITLSLFLVLPTMLLVFMAIFLIIYFLIFGFKRKRFDIKKSYKESVLRKVNTFLLPEADFTHFQFIRQQLYMESKLFLPEVDIYDGEDLLHGKMERIPFQLSKIHTQERIVDSDGKVQLYTLFNGFFFVAELDQITESDTYIFSDTSERFAKAFFSHFNNINAVKPELIKTGSPGFDMHFNCYTTDTAETAQVISDQLMELILNCLVQTKVKPQISIIKNRVFIALPEQKEVFSLSMYRSILNFDAINKYYDYLQFCFAITNHTQRQPNNA